MWRLLVAGLAAGLISGLLGVGGGTVLVPALTLWLRVPDQVAHGSTIAAILPTVALSSLLYARNGFLDWRLALQLAAGGVVGGYAGARLLEGLPETTLRRVFAFFLIVAGAQLLWRG